jgi:hypothetical protein
MPVISTSQPAARPRGALRSLGWLAAGVLLAAFLYAPLTGVLEPSLDASNYASYAYFAAHQFQYGTEVVPMYGPLGFILPGTAYNGLLFWARYAGQLVGGAGFAVLVLWFFHRQRGSGLRWLWLALTLALAPAIGDMPYVLAILLAGLLLLEPAKPARTAPVMALLAFFSLIKGTHLLLALCTLGVLVLTHGAQRRWRLVLELAGAYVVAFLLFWMLAGQSVRHIPAYLEGILSLSSGYNAAMGLEEPVGVFQRGLLALGLLGAGIGWGAWRRRPQPAILGGALLLAGFTFVFWKHGFVRADGHIGIFHHYVAIAAGLWFLFAFAPPAPGRGVARVLLAAALAAGLWIDSPELGPWSPARLVGSQTLAGLRAGFAQLLQPARAKADLDARLQKQREVSALRLIGEEIGTRPVDLFGVRHGIIPLNGWDYRPRPMGGGSFNVYNRHLMGLNRDFLRDPARRPPYYLMRLEPLDDHLGPQEDGLALLELIARYRPVRLEEGYLLLQESPGSSEPRLTPLAKQPFGLGERVPVPAVAADQLLVARFKIPPSTPGSLRKFLYKPPVITITLQLDSGEQLVRRLVPAMAVSTFLFSPTLDDTADFARLYSTDPGKQVASFTVQTAAAWAWGEPCIVEFYTMPRPPALQSPDVEALLDHAADMFNVAPESVVAPATQPIYLGKDRIQPLHAPGRITWPLTGLERALVFDHGLLPEAWQKGGGNGVAFIVELEPPGAAPQKLFERLINPAANPAERRTLRSSVTLPPHLAGSRLVLRTDPGPFGDNSWDWSYVTHVSLQSGLAPRGSTPVFNRVPVALSGNAPVATAIGDRPVTLMHVPAGITFARTAGDRRVHLEFGFMPGAYTGDGRTPGADFVAELVEAGGTAREIFRRTLDPVARTADRGPQSAVVELPAGATGDRIRLRTEPVRGAGHSWGWTYFSRCGIE